jgi:uncharacterized coiled-coil protein SlyX
VSALARNQPTTVANGFGNTAVGSGALQTNVIGSFNTAVGYGANVSTFTLSNATAIGANAVVNASNKIRLGNGSVTVIEGQVAYTFPSDRNQKENFRSVDAREVLERLRELPVTSWNYIGHDPAQFRHYGPMAQDFFAAFGKDEVGAVGTPTTLNSGDLTGILMIGLKGLDAQTREDTDRLSARVSTQDKTIAAQQDQIEAQEKEIGSLKEQMSEIRREMKLLRQGAVQGPPSGAAP